MKIHLEKTLLTYIKLLKRYKYNKVIHKKAISAELVVFFRSLVLDICNKMGENTDIWKSEAGRECKYVYKWFRKSII